MAQNQVQETKQPVKMSIAEIKSMLNNGQDRKAIAAHYGVSQATMKRVFEHKDLKGLRVKPTVPVLLEDESGNVLSLGAPTPAAAAPAAAPAATSEAAAPVAGEAIAPAAAPVAETAAPQGTAAADTKGVW